MAIYHDAYLFSADDFAKFLKKLNVEPSMDSEQLGATVLQYLQDQFVQELCDRYGSWDYQGVETYLNEYKGNKPERLHSYLYCCCINTYQVFLIIQMV